MSPTSSSTPVLQLHHVSHFYKKGAPVLADASFAVFSQSPPGAPLRESSA